MLHFRTPLALAALAALLSACGGGGGSSPIPSAGGSGSSPTQPAQTAPAKMVINIPAPSQQNTHFRPNYISAATQSMTVGLVSGATTTSLVTVNLTQSSPNCTVPSGGGLQCTATVQAPFGTDNFAVSTYSGLNGTGNVLSTGQVQATLTSGGTEPTVQLSLNGVPASVSLVLGTATLPVGYAGSTSVIVQAQDASGNLIIGPGLFSTPITLAISGDTYGTLALSTPQVTAPGQVATLSYNGGTNVGATIKPNFAGPGSTSEATFNATGAVMNLFQYDDVTNGITLEPYDVAPLSGGTAAIATEINEDEGPSSGIAIASTTGISKIFVGDTSNYYSPPESGETFPGVTVVHGMSQSITVESLEEGAFDNLAASGSTVYYSGNTNGSSCGEEETLYTGTFGVLNSSAGTTTEYPLLGYPGPIHVDSAGDVWFIEYSGQCGESNLIPSEYAIGKFNGTTVTETPFASVSGLPALDAVTDMSISPDGSTMYIADNDYEGVYKVSTGSMALTASVELNLTSDVRPIATGSDSTTAWFATNQTNSHYPYGFVPGSATFMQSNLVENGFPVTGFEASTMAYADGSFWSGSSNSSAAGIGRLSGLSTNTPVAGYFPTSGDGVEIQGIGGGNGYVWFVDSCQGTIYSMQYGVPSSGTITYIERRTGAIAYRPRSMMHARPGHHQQRTSRSRGVGAPASNRGSGPAVSGPTVSGPAKP